MEKQQKTDDSRSASSVLVNKENQKKIGRTRKLTGVVVSDKMAKTRVVAITLSRVHPLYQKHYNIRRKLKAHDEKNASKTGDRVVMEETRPISKDKHYRIIEILNPKS